MKNPIALFFRFMLVLSLCSLMLPIPVLVAPEGVYAFGSPTENGTAQFMGIGINPTKILHVSGSGPGSVPLFQRSSDSAGFIIERTSTNRWVLGVNESPTLGNGFVLSTIPTGNTSVPRLMITQDGKVGIGTTSPQAKLDVSGSVKVSESINRGPTNIPLFRWLPVKVLATYNGAGANPHGIAFDGTNMWTSDYNGNSVTKVTPTGNMTTYSIGTVKNPYGIAFDGTNMWTANYVGNSVSKVGPTGAVIGTYSTGFGSNPIAIAFDGANMWTADFSSTGVTKITPAGDTTYYGPTGSGPRGIAFDGTNMWTANVNDDNVTKISPTGDLTNYGPTGGGPSAIAFDGTNIWTANYNSSNVTRITPSGNCTNYGPVGANPIAIAFDGTNMWTADYNGNTVSKITPAGVVTTYSSTGPYPIAIAFDGTSMWTANANTDNAANSMGVSKILVITK